MYRVTDLLVGILETHANVLLKLNAIFSEEVLVEVLERAGAKREEAETEINLPLKMDLRRGAENQAECLAELELVITKIKMPERLEFHLWAYPHYRVIVESDVDISSIIYFEDQSIEILLEDVWAQTEQWLKSLGMKDPYHQHAEKECRASWESFKLKTLRKLGKGLTLTPTETS